MRRRGKDLLLVQGEVELELGIRTAHSWCESEGVAYDNSNGARLANGGRYAPGRGVAGGVRGGKMVVEGTDTYYERMKVTDVHRYTSEEACDELLRLGYYGLFHRSLPGGVRIGGGDFGAGENNPLLPGRFESAS